MIPEEIKPHALNEEIEFLLDWLDAQYDAGRKESEIRVDPYYRRLVAGMRKLRRDKWGRCANCLHPAPSCLAEMLRTGTACPTCPDLTGEEG